VEQGQKKKKPVLFNKVSKDLLKEEMMASDEKRMTISFYRYCRIENPELFRDHLFIHLNDLGVLGRIYVASEGINAQISVPLSQYAGFESFLKGISFLKDLRLNLAIEETGKSFYVLKIKNRKKIVADGIDDPSFDALNTGTYLSAEDFNKMTDDPDTMIIDMRNHYESEVGRFDKAWCPDVDTFREQLPVVVQELEDKKDKKVVMYCTGGIRCEKASAYMRYKGFENVYHLEGGIIKYAKDVKAKGLENKFRGKNFVFDERLEETIGEELIAHCHQCGMPFDRHSNCKNVACNLLFIQCRECADRMKGCCSDACLKITQLPLDVQKDLRRGQDRGIRIFSKGRFKN
jgi:UPF0176 protein